MQIAANVHCWNYSRLLQFQLSSFHLYPPTNDKFSMTVCYDPDDRRTLDVMKYFLGLPRHPNYCLYPMPMTTADLCARGVGKNRFAQKVIAGELTPDWVWYTDVDYSVGPGGLDDVCDKLDVEDGPGPFGADSEASHAVYWPREVMAWDYDISERAVAATKTIGLTGMDYADAVPHRIKVAIGGVQFVSAKTLRRAGGYCQNSIRHQRPSPNGWRENKEDKAFRKQVGNVIELPAFKNLYRMRHRARGAAGKVEL